MDWTVEEKREMLERTDDKIPVTRQCELIDLPRSTAYYSPCRDPRHVAYELRLLREIDELYTAHPNLGRGMMTDSLRLKGYIVNPKRIRRLMKKLGLQAVYPRPRKHTSISNKQHEKHPYLLNGLDIVRPDQVWCADITYIRLRHGFVYLVAVMDWYSRYVISWELSNTLDASFCVDALQAALSTGRKPEIFNTDQGSQFTSAAFIDVLTRFGISISMDGKGRVFDNIMIERLWRTVKYEDVYLRDYETAVDARYLLGEYFPYYNHSRPHSSLDGRTPAEIYGVLDAGMVLTVPSDRIRLEGAVLLDGWSIDGADECPAPVALRAPCAGHTSKGISERITP